MLLTAGRLIKYDLKELFKKHIALYIVTLLAAFGCWALHVLSEYVPDNGITPVAYPVMIAVYVIVCVVLFIVSMLGEKAETAREVSKAIPDTKIF